MSRTALDWTEAEVFAFLATEFPQVFAGNKSYRVAELDPGFLVLEFETGEGQLRPGGTVSGPVQLELADLAVYFLLLAHHGKAARLCVTTNLTCSFLRKPTAGKLICEVTMIKHGRTLAVADVYIKDGDGKSMSHLELTYYVGALAG